jgi:hypothetical protein
MACELPEALRIAGYAVAASPGPASALREAIDEVILGAGPVGVRVARFGLALTPKQCTKLRLARVSPSLAFFGHAAAGLGELGFLLGGEAVVDARALLLTAAVLALLLVLRMYVALGLASALLRTALLPLPLPRLLLAAR